MEWRLCWAGLILLTDDKRPEERVGHIDRVTSLTITYNPTEGAGTTTPSAGVNIYPNGTVVKRFSLPATGYKFNGWGGSCSGTGNCSLTMTANRSVTANFAPFYQNLTIAVDTS